MVVLFFRQEERDVENEASPSDMIEKMSRMSTDDASLTDWHLGFHIFLVYPLAIFLLFILNFLLQVFHHYISNHSRLGVRVHLDDDRPLVVISYSSKIHFLIYSDTSLQNT